MMRFFLLLFTFLSLSADVNRYTIVKEYELSRDGLHYTSVKDFSSLDDVKPFVGGALYHRILLDKEKLSETPYYLRSLGNAASVTNVSHDYRVINNNIIVTVDQTSPEQIIIKSETPQLSKFIIFDILDRYEMDYIFPMEQFWFGLVYGLMFFAFLNSLIFFIYNRQKSFLYYALLQLSLIIFLMNFTYWGKFYGPLAEYVNLFSLSISASLIFSILFNMSFLNTKKYLPRFHKLLQGTIVVILLDLFSLTLFDKSIIFDYFPPYYLLILLLISALLVVKKGHIDARYYLFGWSILVLGIIASATRVIDLSGVYMIHILFPFETVVFSFALGYQLIQIQKKALQQEKILMQQSKLASMGEMVANIAHQWRQPLNNVSCIMMNLKTAYKHQKLTDQLFNKKSRQVDEQLEFMSETIEDFRTFFVMENDKKSFYLKEMIERSIALTTAHIQDLEIRCDIEVDEWMMLTTYENELSHVVFNLFNNAVDVFKSREVAHPKLLVTAREEGKWSILTVEDNAQGIPKKILEKIFEPYFSTKEKGMGIGLYMSKMIIEEHMGGSLSVKNRGDGVCFSIKLPRK